MPSFASTHPQRRNSDSHRGRRGGRLRCGRFGHGQRMNGNDELVAERTAVLDARLRVETLRNAQVAQVQFAAVRRLDAVHRQHRQNRVPDGHAQRDAGSRAGRIVQDGRIDGQGWRAASSNNGEMRG